MFSVIVDEVFEPQKVFPLSSITMRPFVPRNPGPCRRGTIHCGGLRPSPMSRHESWRLFDQTDSFRQAAPASTTAAVISPTRYSMPSREARPRGSSSSRLDGGLTRFRPSSRTGATSLLACSRFAAGAPRVRSPSSPAPLDDESAFALVLEAPPLEGAEYLDAAVLRRLSTSSTSGCEPKRARSAGWRPFWPLGRRPGARCLM